MNFGDNEKKLNHIKQFTPIVMAIGVFLLILILFSANRNIDEVKSNNYSHSSESWQSSQIDPDITSGSSEIYFLQNEEKIIETKEYFEQRENELYDNMSNQEFSFTKRLLDESTKTYAYVLAKNEVYGMNLNGYFYYLLDKTNSSLAISPLILNIEMLFDEDERSTVYANKTYATENLLHALKDSLKAILGDYYSEDVFLFVYDSYKNNFEKKLDNNFSSEIPSVFKNDKLELVFHDSFFTYIEFYLSK